jgi:hypothetical protein
MRTLRMANSSIPISDGPSIAEIVCNSPVAVIFTNAPEAARNFMIIQEIITGNRQPVLGKEIFHRLALYYRMGRSRTNPNTVPKSGTMREAVKKSVARPREQNFSLRLV